MKERMMEDPREMTNAMLVIKEKELRRQAVTLVNKADWYLHIRLHRDEMVAEAKAKATRKRGVPGRQEMYRLLKTRSIELQSGTQ